MEDAPLCCELCTVCYDRVVSCMKKQVSGIGVELKVTSCESSCWLCEGLFTEVKKFAELVLKALTPYEYATFLIGTKLDADILAKENALLNMLEVEELRSLKRELNATIGKLVAERAAKVANFEAPDIVVIVDTRYDVVELEVRSIYLYGRYNKYITGIPQTKWYCRVCRGHGCKRCGGSGKMYPTSVEELIAAPLIELTGCESHAFHGMGREDIDARMLGDGRPFIIELKSPRKRFFSAEQLEAKINAAAEGNVVVRGLRFVSHSAVKHLKAARCDKTYRVEVRFATSIGMDELQHAVRQLEGIEVKQRTPTRVLHRRADLVRVRKIKSFELLELAPSGESCTLELTAESGTYIKEFIQGDNDRTVPDFASTLGVPCIVTQLDVMKVHDKPLDLNQIHF